MNNYHLIFSYHYYRQKLKCLACGKFFNMLDDPPTIQHKYPKPRQGREHKRVMKLLPLFIDSLLNTCLIHQSCNTTKYRSYGRITEYNAVKYQKFLERHPKISNFVNMEE
jgi:hypothetical protein